MACGHFQKWPKNQGIVLALSPPIMDHYFAVCYSQAIGVASTGTIPDSSFSSLSNYDSKYAAKYGRLNGAKSWAPKDNKDANDYLQIDLLFEYVICAVATQGNPKVDEWTTKYKLRLSLDNATFVTYWENSTEKVGLDPAIKIEGVGLFFLGH